MSSSLKNTTAWLKAPRTPLSIEETSIVEPAEGEVLVKVHAVAIEPVDWKIQDIGFFVDFPAVLGESLSGEIYAVGSGVTEFKKGDRVLGHAQALANKKPHEGAFQHYVILPVAAVASIPPSVSFEEASVLPLALSTAACGLYQSTHLDLPLPSLDARKTGKTLLVWGASSSVGATAVQLAVHSGLRVIATASPSNFDFVRALGASAVFDYRDPQAVDLLVAELEKNSEEEEFAGVYDAISEHGSVEKAAEVASKVKGGKKFIATTLPPPKKLPEGVEAAGVFAPHVVQQDNGRISRAILHDFLPLALEKGSFKAKPDPLVAGKGLEELEKAFAVQKKGVSARKVVVSF
ncbi:hypothetical protein JCM8547_007077 [Rhodosporidiobolus lusitaniae]